MPDLRFGVLGPVIVWRGSEAVGLRPGKSSQVLGLLLLHANNRVDRDQIIECAWGPKPPRSALNLVQKCVGDLRRSLGADGGVLETVGSGYRLRVAPDQLDSAVFAQSLTQARTTRNDGDLATAWERLSQAVALWRGPAFSGIDTPAAETERIRLEEYRLAALEDLAELDLLRGEHGLAVAELSRLAIEHPYRERVRELLMIGLYRGERQADAIAVYEDIRRLLADELGANPGHRLQRVHAQVLRADPALDLVSAIREPEAHQPRQLPPDIADFTGQEAALSAVHDLLTGGQLPVVVGAPGTGKSMLAVRAAHRVGELFPDGQLYLDLAGTSAAPRDPAALLAELLRALGVTDAVMPDSLHERAGLYRSRLAGRRVLLLLDDAAGAGQVRLLLPPSGGCAVLVTSRRWLPDLEGAHHVELDVLPPADARTLLARVGGAHRIEREPEASDAIVRLCGYLPLAIRIAGARLASRGAWTLGVLRERLEDESRRLAELRVGDLDVRASFQLSVRQLPEAAGRAFRLMGLLGAETLPGWVVGPLIGEHDAEDVLDALVDANLLRLVDTDAAGQPRYRLHDLLRTYAARAAADHYSETERRAAVQRLLGAWLALAEQARDLFHPALFQHTPGRSDRWQPGYAVADPVSWFDVERATLLRVVELGAEWGLDELVWELALAFVPYYDHRSLYQDWRRSHRIALESTRAAGNAHGQAALLQGVGQVHIYLDELDEARTALEESLRLYRDLGDRRGEALALAGLSTVWRVLERNDLALRCAGDALTLADQVGLPPMRAQLRSSIGFMRFQQGHGCHAGAVIADGLRIARELGDRHREAVILRTMSQYRQHCGDNTEALRCLVQSLTIFNEIGDERCAAYAEQRIGSVYAELDDLTRAGPALETAAGVFRRNGDRRNEAECLQVLGELELRHGAADHADRHLDRARHLWQTLEPVPPAPVTR
nr:BTAD domain-containing putative transcriptional regulator [Lentzea guizhouensis]